MLNRVMMLWIYLAILAGITCSRADHPPLSLQPGEHVVFVGNGLAARMQHQGHLETAIHQRFPSHRLVVRNMADAGNTPGFRPHSGRPNPYRFPGAETFRKPLNQAKDRWGSGHVGFGTYPTTDQWLDRLKADVIIGFFGYNESFDGEEGVENFKAELAGWIRHVRSSTYHEGQSPRVALVSPIAFEDLSATHHTPNGRSINERLALYTRAMEGIATAERVPFVDVFASSQRWFTSSDSALTLDGFQLNEKGNRLLAHQVAETLFGAQAPHNRDMEGVREAVMEKNWMWHHWYKIPNGVHVFGRRHRPFGPDNYPHELLKLKELTANRDQAIWARLENKDFDLAGADAATHPLPTIETNYRPSGKNGSTDYLYEQDAIDSMMMADGFRIELFASEKRFPNLANPVQMSFDNAGRLWVSTMPSYPHYQPGDPRPDDKLLIYEDLDGDGKADKETVFADGLHLPTGFELASEGVYLAQGTHLMLLSDTDGDDQVDQREILLSGFDDHDTHHVISAFCADPSGAIYMGEGTFLHSHIETAYGPVRSSNGGFFRYDPRRRHLERTARLSIPNPWGTAVDGWGQIFFTDTSDPNMRWMIPGTVAVPYGSFAPNPRNLIEEAHRMRPTSGLEFVSSGHFPDSMQGDWLIHNTIGFLGTKQHTLEDGPTGYTSRHRQDLLRSKDGNFRPVDMEFAPDGSLYLVDWHNVLVGHMQHSARDPLRDHVHGRIYRMTYPARPLLQPAKIAGASIDQLLENLKLPEDRTRYRTRRELRGRSTQEVMEALDRWLRQLEPDHPNHAQHLVEAMWVAWGQDHLDDALVSRVLASDQFKARAAAVRAIRYNRHRLSNVHSQLEQAARDPHGRVRLEAAVAASWLRPEEGLRILEAATTHPVDDWLEPVLKTALASLRGRSVDAPVWQAPKTHLQGLAGKLFTEGAEIYRREGHCATCHQETGLGLPAAQFPPLEGSEWVSGSPERLIALTLHGLLGPIEVKGEAYQGRVPMTAFKGLSDREIAAVLTYVRTTFGEGASVITPETVAGIRQQTANQKSFYHPEALNRQFAPNP